jgi:hypothetical protein
MSTILSDTNGFGVYPSMANRKEMETSVGFWPNHGAYGTLAAKSCRWYEQKGKDPECHHHALL